MSPGGGKELGDLIRDRGLEGFVVDRVVHVREREVLPDSDPELVTEVEERLRPVRRDARHADHVHPCVAGQAQDVLELWARHLGVDATW